MVALPELNVATDLRRRYDRSARMGMPPHVTLIYPFLPPDSIDDEVMRRLAALFGSASSFTVRLAGIGGFPGVIYLVAEPIERFVELVKALAALYPAAPPYGGAFDSVIPHLTVAESTDPKVQDLLVRSAAEGLPVEAEANEVWLMVRRRRLWKTQARFALGPRAQLRSDELGLRTAIAS